MKCQHCGKAEATFYYKSTVNGRTTEQRLCRHCAEALGYAEVLRPGRLFDDPFFTRPFSLLGGLGARMLTEFPSPAAEEPEKEARLLEKEECETMALQVRRNALENRLKHAIEEENYEEAAKVRDELRALSAGDKQL